MLTVLFIAAVLVIFSKVLSLADGQRITSGEVGSYLHYEYNMNSGIHPTMAQLKNI